MTKEDRIKQIAKLFEEGIVRVRDLTSWEKELLQRLDGRALKDQRGPRTKKEIAEDVLRRGRRLFPQMLKAQGYKCANCGKQITLETAAKHSYSFDILCVDCYNGAGNPDLIILDDLETQPKPKKA